MAIKAYCMKERKKVTMKDPKPTTMKNGRDAFKGECPNCGTGLFKIAAKGDKV